jgi:ABC-type polar amino acid transport system ATPase subunit
MGDAWARTELGTGRMKPTLRPIVTMTAASKLFGPLCVWKSVTLSVHEGEVIGVIGPSGGGKSTLLKCLNLLERVDAGQIDYAFAPDVRVEGGRITTNDGSRLSRHQCEVVENRIRQSVGFVFQQHNLWEDRTVRDNLTLAPRIVLGEADEVTNGRAEDFCARFGLVELLDQWAWKLSGGERQRVAIIRALMMKPELLLLDEVTSALDPVLIVEVMELIRELRLGGLPMILVTHHLEFAEAVCDRLLYVSRGAVEPFDSLVSMARAGNPEQQRFLSVIRAAR